VGLSYGPSGTPVAEVATGIEIDTTIVALNFDSDLMIEDEGPGKVIYTDITSPSDRPSTLRIAQTVRPNVYAGSGVPETLSLASKKGLDTVIEVKEVWEFVDDDSFATYNFPVRCAITLNVPMSQYVTTAAVQDLLTRTIAGIAAPKEDTIGTGLDRLLHRVVLK